MALPKDERFWSKMLCIAADTSLVLSVILVVFWHITVYDVDTKLAGASRGELIEAGTHMKHTLMLVFTYLFGTAILNLYVATSVRRKR